MTNFNSNGTPNKGTAGDTAIADNPLTEDALDQVIEDSFPASDPPSHTPTTGSGAPKGVPDEPALGRWSGKTMKLGAIGAAALIAVASLVLVLRRRRS